MEKARQVSRYIPYVPGVFRIVSDGVGQVIGGGEEPRFQTSPRSREKACVIGREIFKIPGFNYTQV